MKVYIAGKISGDENYKGKFLKAAFDLELQGITVLEPSLLPEGMTPADYMRICFAMIEAADVVVMLPDWVASRGAMLEAQWCQYVGKPAITWEAGLSAAQVAELVKEAP